jgi:hypothetical protein
MGGGRLASAFFFWINDDRVRVFVGSALVSIVWLLRMAK